MAASGIPEQNPITELEDIQVVFDFVNRVKDQSGFTGFTIHCWRGVSRSAATALGVLYMDTENEETAVKQLMSIRPQARPLNRIVEFWDQILGSDLKVHTDALRKKWTENKHAEMRSYLENEYIEELESV